VLFLITKLPEGVPSQAGFSVPVSAFRHAVDRNRIKRLVREAWRLQKQHLSLVLQENQLQLAVFVVYTGKKIPSFETVRNKISVILNRLIAELPTAEKQSGSLPSK
jgi:ribonuclease P protein component